MQRKELATIIKADLFRYYGNSSFGCFLKSFFIASGFRYSYFFRKCSYYKAKKNWFLYFLFRIFLDRYIYKYGICIPPGTTIGGGVYIGHWGGIFINPEAVIGENCNINQGVTVGQTNRGKHKGCPVIGNFVWMGAHSIIVGNIKIGNNVLIAPGAYVNFHVPDDAVVLGNPGRIISYAGSTGYILNTAKCNDTMKNY